MKTIFTGLSPNTEAGDLWLALKLIFSPRKWQQGAAKKRLEAMFGHYLSLNNAFAFASGRTALFALLSALDLKKDDEVLLQSYTCVAVVGPILWAGLKPIDVDCAPDSFNMDQKDLEKRITIKSKVLIIQHTFGHPADLNQLLAIARKYNLFVIEDCAHSLGAEYEGKKTGTFGDAAFFSFGRDKVISSVFGGMAVTRNNTLAKRIREIQNSFKLPPRSWVVQQLLHPLIVSLAKATYVFLGLGKLIFTAAQKLHLISKTLCEAEKKGGKPRFFAWQMPNALAEAALNQFQKLDRLNRWRIKVAQKYAAALKDLPVNLPPSDAKERPIYLRYTLRVSDAPELLQAAKEKDILLGDWYTSQVAPADVSYAAIGFNPDDYPIAQKLAQESVNLPTHIQMTAKDTLRIIDFLRHRYESDDSGNHA